jgi:hypothetical protein
MPEVLLPLQSIEGRNIWLIEAAAELRIGIITSASICQGQDISPLLSQIGGTLGTPMGTPAQRALQFT